LHKVNSTPKGIPVGRISSASSITSSMLWLPAGKGRGQRTPTSGLSQLLRAAIEDGDVLAGVGVDAFEGPAVGVEVPEVAGAGHGNGEAAYRVPGVGQ
jgi:hypothetical protein